MNKMTYTYRTQGICARTIRFDIDENNTVSNVYFDGGCDGNHKGISALSEGKNANEIINALSGIKCGFKQSSCPDQLARALKEIIEK